MTTKCIPITIGNQTAIIEREAPDTCSAPWCKGRSAFICGYTVIRNGKKADCGVRLCARHAAVRDLDGEERFVCPSHARLLEAKRMGGDG